MVAQAHHTKIYIETKDGIQDPFNLVDNQGYYDIFNKNKEAQALWVLRPGAREPFRITWQQALYPRQHSKQRQAMYSAHATRQSPLSHLEKDERRRVLATALNDPTGECFALVGQELAFGCWKARYDKILGRLTLTLDHH